MTEAIHAVNVQITDKEISDIIKETDYVGNGKINYSDFISATICVESFVNDFKLKVIFQQLDTSNTGVISEQDLFNAF